MKLSLAHDKAFNVLMYFAEHIMPLYLSQAITLRYIADEKAVMESGVPITWLNYTRYKSSHSKDIFHTLKRTDDRQNSGSNSFKLNGSAFSDLGLQFPDVVMLSPIHPFDDSQFSDYEIEVLDEVISQYGRSSGKQLIEILRRKGSFWHKDQFEFEQDQYDYVIELSDLLDTDFKKAAFEVAYQSHLIQENLM